MYPRILHPVGRPITSGCQGPTEGISSFVNSLLQPIAKLLDSYLKDATDSTGIENTVVPENILLVSMDVTNLYTNILLEKGITTLCNAYKCFHNNKPSIPTHFLVDILRLILKENTFQLNGKNSRYMYVEPLRELKWQSPLPTYSWQWLSTKKPLVWKR